MDKILIVDDYVDNRFLISQIISVGNYEPICAENGLVALEILRQQSGFICILMDLEMPQMNGIEAIKKIRSEFPETVSKIPVIAITAHYDPEMFVELITLGFNEVLSKPYTIEKFDTILAKYLK